MAGLTRLYWPLFVITFFSNSRHCVQGVPKVPCYFIFGDSLVDNGNNNRLPTTAKVNYPPYGIDFPQGPTGRFCNGRTTADVFGELMGFENFIKSFASATGPEILQGVNYASGSAGIRDETGCHLGVNIPFNRQLKNHQVTVSRMVGMLGGIEPASNYLNKCLYLLVIGSNDYLNNYYQPKFYNTSHQYTVEQYADVLIEQYAQQTKILYAYGARKIALTGLPPMGSIPSATFYFGTNGSNYLDNMNFATDLFNQRLQLLISEFNDNLIDAKLVYLKTYDILSSYVSSRGARVELTNRCCQLNQFGLCIPFKAPCPDRSMAFFYDGFHPTEIVNRVAAIRAYPDLEKIV